MNLNAGITVLRNPNSGKNDEIRNRDDDELGKQDDELRKQDDELGNSSGT